MEKTKENRNTIQCYHMKEWIYNENRNGESKNDHSRLPLEIEKNLKNHLERLEKLAIKVPQPLQKIRGRKIPHFVELGKTNLLNHPYTQLGRFYKIIKCRILKWTHAMNAY